MQPDTREPRSPESYATFWEPTAPSPAPTPTPKPDAKDAYLEFANATDDAGTPRADRG